MFEKPAPSDRLRTTTCRARVLSSQYRWFLVHVPLSVRGRIRQPWEDRRHHEAARNRGTAHAQVADRRLDETLNKVTFQEKMARRCCPSPTKGLLFVSDMGRFKQINDEHGLAWAIACSRAYGAVVTRRVLLINDQWAASAVMSSWHSSRAQDDAAVIQASARLWNR